MGNNNRPQQILPVQTTAALAAQEKLAQEKIEAEKLASEKSAAEIEAENKKAEEAKNALDSFLNSDNNDINNQSNEAEINAKIDDDGLDWGEKSNDDIPDSLKDLPRKYWKHQTV